MRPSKRSIQVILKITNAQIDELKAIFARYFGNKKEREKSPYDLKLHGADRVRAGFPAAVRIQENETQIRFSFDWGREQEVAQTFYNLYRNGPGRIPVNSYEFVRIIDNLRLFSPTVYLGGPEPELPYESKWRIDYSNAIRDARELANHVFFQNMGSTSDHRGSIQTRMDVVFMKVGVRD